MASAWRPRMRSAATLAAAGLLVVGGLGSLACGDDTPEFEELTRPAESEAVPRSERQMEMTAEERQRAQKREGQVLEQREENDLPEDVAPADEGGS